MPIRKISASYRGASSAYTEFGPPEIMIALQREEMHERILTFYVSCIFKLHSLQQILPEVVLLFNKNKLLNIFKN
jgi:hypothetical protein